MTAALPLIEQPLMASTNGRVEGVLVRGMRMQDIVDNPVIAGNVKSGSLASMRRAAAASRSAPPRPVARRLSRAARSA